MTKKPETRARMQARHERERQALDRAELRKRVKNEAEAKRKLDIQIAANLTAEQNRVEALLRPFLAPDVRVKVGEHGEVTLNNTQDGVGFSAIGDDMTYLDIQAIP